MEGERLYQLLQPEAPAIAARVFRAAHHAMVGSRYRHYAGRHGSAVAGGLGRRIGCRVTDRLRFLLCRIRVAADRCAGGARRRASWQMALAARLGGLDRRLLRPARGAARRARHRCSTPPMRAFSGLSGLSSWSAMRRVWPACSGSSATLGALFSRSCSGSASSCCSRPASPTCWSEARSPTYSAPFPPRCGGPS